MIAFMGYAFSNVPRTIGGSNFWVTMLYLGFVFYVSVCFKTKQTELYFVTLTKDEKPVLYRVVMLVLSTAAIIFGVDLIKNLARQ